MRTKTELAAQQLEVGRPLGVVEVHLQREGDVGRGSSRKRQQPDG